MKEPFLFNQDLRSKDKIQFTSKFDQVELRKENNKIFIEKTGNGKTGLIFFAVLVLAGIIIPFYATASSRLIIAGIAFLFIISSSLIVFLSYQVEIDKEKKLITINKNVWFIKWVNEIHFSEVLDWKIQDGEVGFSVKIKTGDALGFINQVRFQHTICRVAKYEEAFDFFNWIKEIVKPQ